MKYTLATLLLILILSGGLLGQGTSINEVQNFVGKPDTIKVCGTIFSARFLQSANKAPTLFNVDGEYPNQKLTLVIFGEDRDKFPPKPEEYYANAKVCISGVVIDYNGKPEIVLRSAKQLKVEALGKIAPETLPSNEKPISGRSNPSVNNSKTTGENSIVKTLAQANLRLGPSVDFPVVTVVPGGTPIDIVFSNNEWSLVKVKLTNKNNSQTYRGYLKNTMFKK